MEAFQQITVGVGLLPRTGVPDQGSQRAARQAALVARRTGARVTLLHAAWAEDGNGPVELHGAALDELDTLASLVGADGARVQIRVVEEHPWLALVRRAILGKADLVIAGKRGAADRGRRRVGSTAVKLLRTCPVPVWLVKPDHDLQHRHVLAAIDMAPVSDNALESAAWVTRQSEGELHVLHAWNLSPSEQRAASDLTEAGYEEAIEEARLRAQASLEHAVDGLSIDPTLHLERGAAHVQILKELEEEHPDLLVMGSLSQGGRAGFDVGTVAERLLEHVDESLLTFKPKDFVCPVALPDVG